MADITVAGVNKVAFEAIDGFVSGLLTLADEEVASSSKATGIIEGKSENDLTTGSVYILQTVSDITVSLLEHTKDVVNDTIKIVKETNDKLHDRVVDEMVDDLAMKVGRIEARKFVAPKFGRDELKSEALATLKSDIRNLINNFSDGLNDLKKYIQTVVECDEQYSESYREMWNGYESYIAAFASLRDSVNKSVTKAVENAHAMIKVYSNTVTDSNSAAKSKVNNLTDERKGDFDKVAENVGV